ncbi:AAA family ATPase [Phaeobacter inhibens]|nr:AAA family ATPase [Phaeobacter inhibens]
MTMSKIRFIHSKFPDPEMAAPRIEKRLSKHLQRLQERKAKQTGETSQEIPEDDASPGQTKSQFYLHQARRRVARRAGLISERYRASLPISRLKLEDRKRLEARRDGVQLVQLKSENHADEIAARLHAEFPWLAIATEQVWHSMLSAVRSDTQGLRIRPLLLDGPPGIGKSAWARRLASLMGVPNLFLDATVESASFGLVGSQRGWSNSAPGRLINLVLEHGVGNPLVIIDEVEKAGKPTSQGGHTFNLLNALLPLFELQSARRWSCPYFQVECDMSWIGWILTSNDWRQLPDPILSRCPPIRLQPISAKDLCGFAMREASERGLSDETAEVICDTIAWALTKEHRLDLRAIIRMLERGERLEQRSARN